MRLPRIAVGLTALCLLSLGASAHAQLIIEDTFTGYPDNALISASPSGPALGLTGDWMLPTPSDFYVNKTQADDTAGTGKAVYDRPSDHNGAREAIRNTSAEHELFTHDGDVFYASFLIDPALADGRMTFELKLEGLGGGGVSSFSFGIIDGQFIVGNGGVDINVSGGMSTASEQLVVVRVEYGDGDTGPDDYEIVTAWVNPINESSTPVIDHVSTDFLNRGGAKITAVSIRGDQMFGQPAFFDDIRVGFSFEAVAPRSIPTVSEWGLIIMSLLLVTAGTILFRRRSAAGLVAG